MRRAQTVTLALSLTGLALAGSADAQPSAIPPDIAERIRALGPVLNDEVRLSARSAYTPLQPQVGPQILVKADLSYGPDERHKLDVFAPVHTPSQPVPVVIYFHGGAYVRGEAINLFKALCERDNRCPPMKQLRGHNHMTEVYHIGTTDDSLSAELIAFVRGLK